MVPNPATDLWRAVRQREAPAVGSTQARGVETGVLIDSSGEEFRNYRRDDFIGVAAMFLGGVTAAILLFYILRGKIRIPGGKSGKRIKRFADFQRTAHWFTAILFIFLALTGLTLLFGRFVVLPVFGPEAFAVIASACKEGHNLFGPLFLVSVILLFVLFAAKNLPVHGDLKWLTTGGGIIGKSHAPAGFFNTGEKIWEFQLSKRGVNVTPVVVGTTVYIAHSEENVDTPTMGRVVAIDATGSGDITSSGEIWRADAVGIGFSSPLHHDGVLYVVDNSSNLLALDAATGAELWQTNVGTVGKSSPVFADGKIYYTEVNGRVYIVLLGPDGAEIVDTTEILMPDGERHAEIYGSPAIAYGRIYVSTEAGVFGIGDPSASYSGEGLPLASTAADGSGEPAWLQVVPTEVIAVAGENVQFEVRAFDANGNPLGAQEGASWMLEGVSGTIDGDGAFRAAEDVNQAGKVIAELGGLSATARVRSFGSLPWSTNFESGAKPAEWMGGGRYQPAEMDGGFVLRKQPSPSGLHRHVIFMGPDSMTGYTVQADLMGTRERRRRPDLGLINGSYTLDLQGNYQRLEVRAWASELRLTKQFPEAARVPFEWNEDTWYTMKLRVDVETDGTLVRGKVWERGTAEPDEWTISVKDPLRNSNGAPGIYGYAPVDIFYDNVSVTENQ